MTMLCPWCREAFDPAIRQFHECTISAPPTPDHIEVRFWEQDSRYMTIDFAWRLTDGTPLDRPIAHGMVVLARNVHRLTRAFLSDQLYTAPRVAWDIDGHTYIAGTCRVQAKTANRDLTRIGF